MPFCPTFVIRRLPRSSGLGSRPKGVPATSRYSPSPTLGAAYAAFEEREKGSLTPGKWADFVVLATDPRQDPAGTRVVRTVIGGEVVYEG